MFEEAAVDLGKGLRAWSDSRSGKRHRKRVGFPSVKKKTTSVSSFRLRNKHPNGRPAAIRVGDGDRLRSLMLPGIGQIAVHDNTRRLRRMLATDRAKILFATVTHRADRRWVSLNVEAAALHPAHQHPPRDTVDTGGWVGVDRGLSVFVVAATTGGEELARITDAPKPPATGIARQRCWPDQCPERRKDHATAAMPPPAGPPSPPRRQRAPTLRTPGLQPAGQDRLNRRRPRRVVPNNQQSCSTRFRHRAGALARNLDRAHPRVAVRRQWCRPDPDFASVR